MLEGYRNSFEESNRKYFESMERQNRRFFFYFYGSLVALVLVLFLFGYYIVTGERDAHLRFMRQCTQDHKEYECTALWRAGDHPPPGLVILPMPTGR